MRTSSTVMMAIVVVGVTSSIGLAAQWSSHRSGDVTTHGVLAVAAPGEGATGRSNDGRDARLDGQLAALAAEVSMLKERLTALQGSADAGVAVVETAPSQARTIEEARAEWHAHIAEVEASFSSERLDPRWAAETAANIERAVVSEPGLRAAMRKLECRSETCRLELVDKGTPLVGDAMPQVLLTLGRSLPASESEVVKDHDGKSIHVVFLSRSNDS